ncbi:hypothetical protein [Microbacterium sp. GXF6406]
MNSRIVRAVFAAGLAGAVLSGCSAPVDEEPVDSGLTWQEAKAAAQETEREIAALVPEEDIVSVEQKETGVLLSCDEESHNWNGFTTVTMVPGVDIDALVKDIEAHYADDPRFESRSWMTPGDTYAVQLMALDTAANYIISEDERGTFRIESGSECFILPEDVYPGGTF